jgi:putative pyruvate formate lyase activating enzyme
MFALSPSCTLCPRRCGVDRRRHSNGVCGQGEIIRAAWAGLHMGEEPDLVGERGSGTIFFSGCSLRCACCQNRQISRQGLGAEMSIPQLAALMLRLQEAGAANVNLVTGGHFLPAILKALNEARRLGLVLPLVWNSSAYETPQAVRALSAEVDLFVPDCKTLNATVSATLMKAPDYPEVARGAIEAMAAAKPLRREGSGGRLIQGVLVRHLVLPGLLEDTREVLAWFRERLAGRALISVMFQYTPPAPDGEIAGLPSLRRGLNPGEVERVRSWLEELGIEEGYIQEAASDADWLPDFRRDNPFPPGQARMVWYYGEPLPRNGGSAG